MNSKTSIVLAMIGLLACGLTAQAQIQNGGFENWGTITSTGTYSYGAPNNWTLSGSSSQPQVSNPMQVAGLTSGSNYAAVVQTGAPASGYGAVSQTISGALSSFQLTFDLAVTQWGTNRSAQIWIGQSVANGNTINLIINGSGTVGKLGLQVRNDNTTGVFNNIGSTTGINATTYNTTTGAFSNINAYRFTITANNFNSDNGALSYNVAYGTLINDVYTEVASSGFISNNGAPNYTNAGLGYISFVGAYGGATTYTPYIVDNVTVTAIPEPTAMALMAGGLLLLCGRQMRRKY